MCALYSVASQGCSSFHFFSFNLSVSLDGNKLRDIQNVACENVAYLLLATINGHK